MNIEQQRAAFDNRPFHEITLRAKDLEELGLSVVFINSGRNDSNELARKNALLIKSAIELDRQGRGDPAGWLRNERGEATGKAIFDPLLILGASAPTKGYEATYSPVYMQPADPTIKESLTVAEPVKEVSVPGHLIERLRKHCDDKENTAFARSSMREALQYLTTPPADEQPQQGGNMPDGDYDDEVMRRINEYHSQPPTCASPMGDKPACGAQNAECERQREAIKQAIDEFRERLPSSFLTVIGAIKRGDA